MISPLSFNGFCAGEGTDMNMDGFTSIWNEKPACINFLFKTWTMDNEAKFAFGCIGAFAMAVLIEFLGWLRRFTFLYFASPKPGTKDRQPLQPGTKDRQPLQPPDNRKRRQLVLIALFGLQVLLGYWLMLLAMTYQVELFICVVAGLVVGHFLFNMKNPPETSADPCCIDRDEDGLPVEASKGTAGSHPL
jgi:copper transporter 1